MIAVGADLAGVVTMQTLREALSAARSHAPKGTAWT
jgi:hypothetical protein